MPRLAQMIQNDPLFPGRGAPGGPLICARFQQEKMKRFEFNKKRRPKQEKGSTVLIIVQIIVGFCVSQAHDLIGRLLSIWRSGVLAVLAFWPTWRDLQSGFRAGANLAGAVLARVWPFWRPPRSGDRPVRTARNDPSMTPN